MEFVAPMKSSYNPKPKKHHSLPKKQAKLKNVPANHIAQRYMDLLCLRGQVYELEQRSLVKSGVARAARNGSASSLLDQPGDRPSSQTQAGYQLP
jgi:hypothetical protein